jgi:lysophospholipase L1-like esterase
LAGEQRGYRRARLPKMERESSMAKSTSVTAGKRRKNRNGDASREDKAGPRRRKLSWWKKILFALIPVSLLLASLEGGLWLFGYDSPVADPYESFVLRRPLFVANGDELQTAFPRQTFFHLQRFAKTKPAGTKRIFVFGGSTTYGYTPPPKRLPDYNPREDSYVHQLGELLEERFPDTRFEMINCGGLSYASYRLVDLVEECVQYSPDLVIVMSGHNEFIEARHYQDLFGATSPAQRMWYSLRTVRLVQHLTERLHAHEPFMGENPFVTERYIVRDEAEFQHTLDHYTRNLNRMIDACRGRDVPIILCTCASNLLDHPPFYTEPPPGMTEGEFFSLIDRAIGYYDAGQYEEALALADQVLRQDPRSAEFHYIRGICYYAMNRFDEAKASLILAKDTDSFPKRTLTSFNERVREIARQRHVPLFDAEERFFAEAENGIPGSDLFSDDCHPLKKGHRIFAEGLLDISADVLRKQDPSLTADRGA